MGRVCRAIARSPAVHRGAVALGQRDVDLQGAARQRHGPVGLERGRHVGVGAQLGERRELDARPRRGRCRATPSARSASAMRRAKGPRWSRPEGYEQLLAGLALRPRARARGRARPGARPRARRARGGSCASRWRRSEGEVVGQRRSAAAASPWQPRRARHQAAAAPMAPAPTTTTRCGLLPFSSRGRGRSRGAGSRSCPRRSRGSWRRGRSARRVLVHVAVAAVDLDGLVGRPGTASSAV